MEESFYERIDGYHSINVEFPSLMRKVYTWMTLALIITAVTGYGIASSPILSMHIDKFFWILLFVELAVVIVLGSMISRLSLTTATTMFIVYSILNGVTLSSIFVVYSPMVITKVFLITAGTFGATALYGYTTKKDLSMMRKILFMSLLGLIIATFANFFMRSTGFDYILSYIGVIIFVGLTAYDTQKVKKILQVQSEGGETAQKIALIGALSLYLDFMNLFLSILKIFGNKK